jgi:hypothetical protein
MWVASLLKTSSPEEYGKQPRVMQFAIDGGYKDKDGNLVSTPVNVRIIQEMLNPASDDPHYTVIHWTRWLRFHCPTTSDPAESVHGPLNASLSRISDLVSPDNRHPRASDTPFLSKDVV